MKILLDVEADGFLDKAEKIHVLSWAEVSSSRNSLNSLSDYDEMRKLLSSATVIIGHNMVRYDIPLLEKILGIKIEAKVYDTLPMSWVMFPDRNEYGLDSFGRDYGIPKPQVDDWDNLTYEEYRHRCEEDVKINLSLWEDLINRFRLVYGKEKELLDQYLQYLTFKMKCAAMAEESMWRLDVDLARKSLDKLEELQKEKVEELKEVMPKVEKYKEKKKPAQIYKKDGNLTKLAVEWFELLEEKGYAREFEGPLSILDKKVDPNPNSSDQVKSWLFSLGWNPCTFDFKKNNDGSERQIPQVRKDGELAPSVVVLAEEHPEVQLLEGLTVIQHRKAIFEGLLESAQEVSTWSCSCGWQNKFNKGEPNCCPECGNREITLTDTSYYVKAEIAGLTNTLRFKHKKPLVNLPGVDKPWGKEVRGCLVASPNHILCGADMTSLESTTKRHFIYPYDPDYVAEMSQEGFDEHLDLAVKAGYLDLDDYLFYINSNEDTVNDKDRFKKIKKVRKKFKPVNYSSVYGVGKVKLSRTTGMSESEAEKLLNAYWDRNWSVKAFAEDQEIRTVNGQMWVRNPVNRYWYTLRFKKDAFSTLNQGTGAYCFDQWVAYYLLRRPNIIGQFHDESINDLKPEEKEEHTEALQWAIEKVNEKLKLNVDLGIDVQYGDRYSEIH